MEEERRGREDRESRSGDGKRVERGVGKIQEATREGKEEEADGCGREVD